MMGSMVLIIIIFLILSISTTIFLVIYNKNNFEKQEKINDLKTVLENKGYYTKAILYVNQELSLMINKQGNKLCVIRNFSPALGAKVDVEEVLIQFIKNFEIQGNTIILKYYKGGEEKTITISPLNNEVKDFIHKIFYNSCSRKIIEKLRDYHITLFGASDYLCSYFWGYSPLKSTFCYLKLQEVLKKPLNYQVRKYNLLKENFTIDVKYNYFEAPVDGIAQQLSIYENNFLSDLFVSLLSAIKDKYSVVCEDRIYFNRSDNIVYLTNNINSLLGLRLDEVEEVEYFNNRISFIMKYSQRRINYLTTQEFINEFDDFVVGCNLRKIANSFNYTTDKLVNATDNTKFIVDFSRSRLIYCANINTFSRFSYIMFSFKEVFNVKLEKNAYNIFVRIFLKNNQIIDVSCSKYEVGEYIMALIRKIMDGNY